MKFVSLLVLVFLSACAGKSNVISEPQPQPASPQLKQYPIDFSKVKTVDDLKSIVELLLPPDPALNVIQDSLRDSKRFAKMKHFLKEEQKVNQR